jgi:hypothetical protein
MADKERLKSLTSIENDVQITERIKHAMENYISWFRTLCRRRRGYRLDLMANGPYTVKLRDGK